MCQDGIMEGFWIFQDSKYARLLQMQALRKVLNMPEYGWIMPKYTILTMTEFWICLVTVLQGFGYACGFKYDRILIMEKLWMCKG